MARTRKEAMEFVSVDLADASSHSAPNHLSTASHALLLRAAISFFFFHSFFVFFFLPSFGSVARKIHIADQIEIIHYLNNVATTVRDLLVDVAPDSPL